MLRKLLLFATIILYFLSNTVAQKTGVDFNKLIKDTQKSTTNDGVIDLVWWLPKEFWEASFAANGKVTAESEELLDSLSKYNIIGVVKGEIGTFGDIKYVPVEKIRSRLFLYSNDVKRLSPLTDNEINFQTQMVLQLFKPMLKNMLGNMGENFHFFVFEGEKDGKMLFNPKKEGNLKVELLGTEYEWKLPLGSLLPPKYCEKCEKNMPGDWKYCPYHGKKLKLNK